MYSIHISSKFNFSILAIRFVSMRARVLFASNFSVYKVSVCTLGKLLSLMVFCSKDEIVVVQYGHNHGKHFIS